MMFASLLVAQTQGDSSACFPYCLKCQATVADPAAQKILSSVEFKPVTGEEELTQKALDVPATGLKVHAMVFFTDEALASNAGNDSIELTLAVATARQERRKEFTKKAVAEMTLNSFDTGRVSIPIYVGKKALVAVLQCQGPKSNDGNKE